MKHLLTRRSLLKRTTALSAAGCVGPAFLLRSGGVAAQADWPVKPVRFINGYPAGGASDSVARMLTQYMQQSGITAVVENRPGAGGIIGVTAVATAPADGYTFGFTTATPVTQARVLYRKLPYNPDTDLVYVGAVDPGGLTLAVNKAVAASSLADLIELAKKQQVNLGSYAPGSFNHMFVQQVNKLYGTRFEVVHYQGEAPMWQDVASGQAHAAIGSYGTYRPFLERGDIRPIGLGGSVHLPNLPQLPLFSEQGFKGDIFTQSSGWVGMVAPAKTPPALVERVSTLFVKACNSAEGKQVLASRGLFGKVMDTQEHTEWQRQVGPKWIAIARQLGITLD